MYLSHNAFKLKPEEQMADKIQMTEEQSREFIKHVCIRAGINCKWIEVVDEISTISELKKHGYIRKNPVEEAEEMYIEWKKSGYYSKKHTDTVEKQHEAIRYLLNKEKK